MTTAKMQSAPAATVDLQETRCTCGCGETTPARPRFRPGHDQRLKGQLARAHYATSQVAVVQPDGAQQNLSAEQAARLLDTDRFSWSAKLAGAFPLQPPCDPVPEPAPRAPQKAPRVPARRSDATGQSQEQSE